MRKSICLQLALLFCLAAGVRAAQWTMSITESTRGIPSQNIVTNDVTIWTNAISVTAGDYYQSTASRVYMAVDAGTSTNAPTHRAGVSAGADGISWLFCGTNRGDRTLTSTVGKSGVIACVLTGNEIHYNRNADATTNMPWTVKRTFDAARGDWRFIPADGGTSTVSFLEL